MLDREWIAYGLDALARAHRHDWFADGHRGAAVLSAAFFLDEEKVEPEVPAIMGDMIRREWDSLPVFQPLANSAATPELVERVAATLDQEAHRYRQAGHNIIFGSLALKAFHTCPDLCTPERVQGICDLLQCVGPPETYAPPAPLPDLPPLEIEKVAGFILEEFPACTARFHGRGQGWSGHLLTFGRAIVDLLETGWPDVAEHAAIAFAQYIARIRMGPGERDTCRPEHPGRKTDAATAAYWKRRAQAPIAIGHCFKYPYGLYGLLARCASPDVRRQAEDEAWRVL